MSESLVPYSPNLPDSPDEIVNQYFSIWETRGRGWDLFDFPVDLEPPFCPLSYLIDAPEQPIYDDGKKTTFLSRLLGDFDNSNSKSQSIQTYHHQISEYQSLIAKANEPSFCQYYNTEFIELQLVLPKDLKVIKTVAENLLLSLSYLAHPISFELIGNEEKIVIQFACTPKDLPQVRQQISTHLPNCSIKETSNFLIKNWLNSDPESLIVDFGLSNEFIYPLKTISHFEVDYLMTIVGALSNLQVDEIGVFQILFQKVKNGWATEMIESVRYLEEINHYHKTDNSFHFAKEKVKSPLFAVCLRIAGKSFDESRTWQIVKSLGAALVQFSNSLGNELIPLSNENYPEQYHEQALLNRQSFRSGILLNLDELVSLVHLPSNLIQSEKLPRNIEKSKAAPDLVIGNSLILGENYHQGEIRKVSLSENQRARHIHLIGSSGSGKSSLLLSLIKQNLEYNQGLCVIDPHGDLIEAAIENIPHSRVKDVVLFDPADCEFPIGFNILQAKSELEKNLLSSDLIATFRRMSTSWGDVMDSVLANAILAFVESKKGGTLFELKRFLVEKDFRKDFLETVSDEGVRYFWQNEFPLITGKPQSSILIRLDTFLRQKLIRNIVCQKENKLDFRNIMDKRKVLLVKLSQGLIGEENAYLLGTLIISKLYQTALSRQDSSERPFFSCYLDEFHHFITPSMEGILSGVRKYNLGLVLAHQEFRQLQSRNSEVASSVLSNCYTRVCFRLGDADSEKFASGFSFFDSKALQNLGIGEAIVKVERSEYDFNMQTTLLPKVSQEIAEQVRNRVVNHSRANYATLKNEVETNLFHFQTRSVSNEVAASSNEGGKGIRANLSKNVDKKDAEPLRIVKEDEAIKTQPKLLASTSLNEPVPKKDNHQHRYLQSLIKRIAENKGFLATVEKQVLGGLGKIDVALERENLKIACEISVTTPPDYELQNIQKCLTMGYSPVIMVSTDKRHLNKIKQKVEENLSEETVEKIMFLEPEEVYLFLENLDDKKEKNDSKVKGFKVNVKLKPIDESEQQRRTKTISEVILGAMKRLKKDKSG